MIAVKLKKQPCIKVSTRFHDCKRTGFARILLSIVLVGGLMMATVTTTGVDRSLANLSAPPCGLNPQDQRSATASRMVTLHAGAAGNPLAAATLAAFTVPVETETPDKNPLTAHRIRPIGVADALDGRSPINLRDAGRAGIPLYLRHQSLLC